MMRLIPRSRSTDKRFYGVVEALVTDNVDPDQQGRVQVKFPWFDDQYISEWCRVMQPYAGLGYGMFFVPEVDAEVVVAFGHGDMRFPIVLGGVYNGKDKPPSHRDAKTDEKMIRTKGGHIILLNDSNNNHQVWITTNGGQSITLDDQARSVTITTIEGQSITLDPKGGVTVSAKTVTIAGATSVNLGQAAASSLILGELFMDYFNLHTHNCTAPGTPSGPPVPEMSPVLLSRISKTS